MPTFQEVGGKNGCFSGRKTIINKVVEFDHFEINRERHLIFNLIFV